MNIQLQNTIVFFKNLEALNARNSDGSRKYKYIINQGSSRSSKTYSLIDLFDYYARLNTNERLTIWRDTKTDCKKTVLSDMLKHHKKTYRYQLGYTFNKTESIFYYQHGKDSTTTVEIHGTDDEETVHGLTQNIAWLNEPYKISKDTFDQIDMRSDVVFIDYNPKKDHYIEKIAMQENAIVIHSTYKSNPFCPEEQRIKIESYQPISMCFLVENEKEKEEHLQSYRDKEQLESYLISKDYEGKCIREALRCWQNEKQFSASGYKWQVYGLGLKSENPNKIYNGWIKIPRHEYDEIKRAAGYQVYYGLDFGFANPSACVEVMYDGDRTLYVRQMFYKPLNQCKMSLGDALIECGVPTGNKTYIMADPQDNLVGVSTTMVNDLRTFHALNVYKATKPTYPDRFEFMNKLVIKFTDDSADLESEYDEYEYEYINDQPTEKPIKCNDHLMNALEYIAWFLKVHLKIQF